MITLRSLMTLAQAAALAGVLAGCGGGGGGDGDGQAPPPVTADAAIPTQVLATVDTFSAWMVGEATARAADEAEPLKLGAAMPPESDTTEPVALR
jgi:hypothetical protein